MYPEIGFIHEPGDAKFPLCYDLADIFKPILVDRTIFKVFNKTIIEPDDAFVKNGKCLLKKPAKKKFVEELNDKLFTIINNRYKNIKMSYKRIIREEAYKIFKQIAGEENYKPFIMNW